MRKLLHVPAVRFGLTTTVSTIFVILWLVNDSPIAILPALLTIWIPLFIQQGSPPAQKGLRIGLTAVGVGILLLGVIVLTYVYFNVR